MKLLNGPKKKIIIILGIVILIGGAGAGGLMMGKKLGAKAAPKPEKNVNSELVEEATGGHEAKAEEGEAKEGEAKKEEGGKEGEAKEGEGKEGEGEAKANKAPTKKDLIFEFDKNFTVNLNEENSRWFIQLGIKLEAPNIKAKEQIDENQAPLRDATIMLLSSKKREEVQTPEDKIRLQRELLARYEGILEPGTVKNIYFDNYTVMYQR